MNKTEVECKSYFYKFTVRAVSIWTVSRLYFYLCTSPWWIFKINQDVTEVQPFSLNKCLTKVLLYLIKNEIFILISLLVESNKHNFQYNNSF